MKRHITRDADEEQIATSVRKEEGRVVPDREKDRAV